MSASDSCGTVGSSDLITGAIYSSRGLSVQIPDLVEITTIDI